MVSVTCIIKMMIYGEEGLLSKRKPIVGISMKMYQNIPEDAEKYVSAIKDSFDQEDIDIFIFPSLGTLYPIAKMLNGSKLKVGAQNVAPVLNGAFTGELSIETVKSLGGQYVEIGHSERRSIFKESDDVIARKVKLTLDSGLIPVLCIGEPEKWNDSSKIKHYLNKQLSKGLEKIEKERISDVILAYEPVWAIGAQESAQPDYINNNLNLIREIIGINFSPTAAEKIRIIYGGSVSNENVEKIAAYENIDGVFVGRFGHDPANFISIVETVGKIKRN